MKIKRVDLLKLLDKASIGMGDRSATDLATRNFIFSNNKVISFNDQISVICKTDYEGLDFALPGEELLKLVQKSDSEYLTIKNVKGNKLKFRGENILGEIQHFNSSDILFYVKELDIDKVKFQKIPDDFFNGLKLCLISTNDGGSGYDSTVLFDKDLIITSDSFRISIFKMGIPFKNRFVLKAKSIKQLLKFDNMMEYAVGESWVYFRDKDGIDFCLRGEPYMYEETIGEYKFPDELHKYFDKKGDILELPKGTAPAVEAAAVMAEEGYGIDKNVDVKINEKGLEIRSEKDIGWIKKTIPHKFMKVKEDIDFSIDPDLFLEILGRTRMVKICKDNTALFKFENFSYIMTLNT